MEFYDCENQLENKKFYDRNMLCEMVICLKNYLHPLKSSTISSNWNCEGKRSR